MSTGVIINWKCIATLISSKERERRGEREREKGVSNYYFCEHIERLYNSMLTNNTSFFYSRPI